MILDGEIVKKLGSVDKSDIQKLVGIIQNNYRDQWVKRTLKVMESTYVLKVTSPTQHDMTPAAAGLMDLCLPIVKPFIGQNERIIYLDVSCLPKGVKSLVHFDYAWIHVLSRRIHIPLLTHDKAVFAALTEDNKIHSYNLKVGSAYEVNNQTLHAVANSGDEDRWHLLADVIDNSVYEYLVRTDKIDKAYINKWCQFYFNDKIKKRIEDALDAPAKTEAG